MAVTYTPFYQKISLFSLKSQPYFFIQALLFSDRSVYNTCLLYTSGVGVCMAAWFYVLHRVKSRHDAFVHQLGDCLSLVANALRAGFSFLQTMELISREMQPPMNTEFGRVVRETSLGVPMEQALRRMDARVNSPDFSLIVTAVIIQQQVGGNRCV